MLNKLSLSADDDQDAASSENSESRMLRALEALSSQPPETAPQPRIGDGPPPPFRPAKPNGAREPFRNDAPYHVNKGRHRFVRDGEVPVVHMTAPRTAAPVLPGRGDADWTRLQQQHDEQKQRAELAERGRAEAQMQIKTLQTKLAHTELTLGDAQTLAQTRQDELLAARQEIARLRPPPPVAPPLPGELVKRGPGRPRKVVPVPPVTAVEPQPVEWWLMPAKGKRRA